MDTTEFEVRRRRVARDLETRKLDALILAISPNVRYLTGFTGSNAMVLLEASGRSVLFTDPRYEIQASQESGCTVRIVRGPIPIQLMQTAKRRKLRTLGFEKARIPFGVYEQLREKLYLGASLEPVAGVVETHRMVKSAEEIALIRASVDTNSQAFTRAMKRVKPGMRESEVAAELDYEMRRLGAEQQAFETIVACGRRSALPHARPGASVLAGNQLLLIDMGASREGYASDMTRMAFLGTPGRKVNQLYRAVLEAQLAAVAAVRPGVRAARIDSEARRVLKAHQLDRVFVHSTGHGLGLEIHEPPRLGKRDATRLAAGMVITVEPGAYVEGFGGVRIEDTVLVTGSGCEVLTPTPKELLIL